MTDQIFNGSVGQVAGGNINNYGPVPYSSLSIEKLYQEQSNYKVLLWAARKRLYFNLYNVFLAVSTLGLAITYFYLLMTKSDKLFELVGSLPPWALFAYALIGIVLPMLLVHKKRLKEAARIADCHAHLREIDIALNKKNSL